MAVLRHLLWAVAKRVAGDPRVREKAVETFHRVRPRLAAAAREIHVIASETPPHSDPRAFARKLRERVLKRS